MSDRLVEECVECGGITLPNCSHGLVVSRRCMKCGAHTLGAHQREKPREVVPWDAVVVDSETLPLFPDEAAVEKPENSDLGGR